MGQNSLIETGVDKLVNLIRKDKKISIADAAKQLGVSTVVVEEWADFLEEEGIISIEYKFTTPYLVEKLVTKEELARKEKEFGGKREAFVRKAEVALAVLDREGDTFQGIKDQFEKLKEGLADEVKKVKGDLKELEKYEELKNNLAKQIADQQKIFTGKIKEIESQVSRDEKKYADIISSITQQEKKLDIEKSEALSIRDREAAIRERLDSFRELIDKLEKSVEKEDSLVVDSEEHITGLRGLADEIKKGVEEKRKFVESVLEESKAHEERLLEMHDSILTKAKEKRDEIERSIEDSRGATSRLRVFFDKKAKIEAMIANMTASRNELEKEMIHLIQKAKAFSLASKSSGISLQIAELRKTFAGLDKKRELFEGELKKLSSLVMK